MTAELSAPSLERPADPHNAFTVDLEEWFHVCGVEPLRFERWATLPSRVEPTTRWLLDALDCANVRATFFIVGWVAERSAPMLQAVRDAGAAGPLGDAVARLDTKFAALESGPRPGARPGPASVPADNFTRMNGELAGLLRIIDGADRASTTQAVRAVAELDRARGRLAARWAQLRRRDLAELNRLLRAAGRPAVGLE